MDAIQINSGEYIGMRVFHVTAIPHISTLLTTELTTPERERILTEYANEMKNLLAEVYQIYKSRLTHLGGSQDLAIETLWQTHAVHNQPFKAEISLYLVVRSIQRDRGELEKTLETVGNLVQLTIKNAKYDYEEVSEQALSAGMGRFASSRFRALAREERMDNLQNNYIPACYGYDLIAPEYPDLSRIVNVLIEHPDCMLSFQLMPTYLSVEEDAEIGRLNQMLNVLRNGVQEQNVGNVSFTAAERAAALYQYYAQNHDKPLYTYNILIAGDSATVTSVGSRVLSSLTSNSQAGTSFKFVDLPYVLSASNQLYSMPWQLSEMIINTDRRQELWQTGLVAPCLFRLPYVITSEEAAVFFRLPIGDEHVSAGLQVNQSSQKSRTYSKNIINAGDIEVGKLKASGGKSSIGFSLSDLAKHMLIVGTPGSGKTTFSVGLLDRLWRQHHIPFLVIEPAKNEYRALIQSIPDLQVFTPGKNFISPFVFNPFVPPKNVRLETYKSTLKTAFAAGVSMSTPLDKIFEETVNNCYSDFRWLDTYTTDNQGQIFNITDFIKCFQETFNEIGYTGDARNIGRAGIVRLKSLVNLFDNYFSIPIEDLLSKPTVIELAAIENADQKALIIALLLLSILAYVNANYVGEGGLKNFILLEEAHVLLDADTNSGQEGAANPAAIAQGLVKRMLAEIRSYGVGLAIADQSPRKVGLDIVALTDIKVAFRLVEAQDKQLLGDSSGMSEQQIARLTRLKPGEAFLFFNKLEEPEEIVTPDYRLENRISISLSDESIRQQSTYWNSRQDKLRPYPQCAFAECCNAGCDYHRRLLAREVARRIFRRYVPAEATDPTPAKQVLAHIEELIRAELNDEPYSAELRACVKVHFWRKLMYETHLRMRQEDIKRSVSK